MVATIADAIAAHRRLAEHDEACTTCREVGGCCAGRRLLMAEADRAVAGAVPDVRHQSGYSRLPVAAP